jgi:hypothetical protein
MAAQASNYPPDYATCDVTDTVTTGPFQLIRHTSRVPGKQVQLTVSYRGYLRSKYPDNQIHIYVSLNGQNPLPPTGSATIQASAGTNNDAYIYLNAGVRNCQMCFAYMASSWPECKAFLDAGNYEGQWLCQQPSALENHMFYWAFDQNLNQNAWDIYVAAEANGEWDSNGGANFYGRLPARSVCASY